jgi:hypothetical protein
MTAASFGYVEVTHSAKGSHICRSNLFRGSGPNPTRTIAPSRTVNTKGLLLNGPRSI